MKLEDYTEAQRKAILTRNCDILVAAAAGSGKTAILVERIIQLITDKEKPVDIDTLLILTFTDSAASEMRQRISDALTERISGNPSDENLQRQASLLNRAYITTIHSFCLNVVKKNFNLVDIDPNFRIGDSAELEILKNEVIEALFEKLYADENNEAFLNLVETYTDNKSDKKLVELVLEIYKFIQSCPYPEKWLDEKAEFFNLDDEADIFTTMWGELLKEDILRELNSVKFSVLYSLNIIKKENAIAVNIEKSLKSILTFTEELISVAEKNIGNLYEYFEGKLDFGQLRLLKTDTLSQEAKEEIQAIKKEEITPVFKNISEKILFVSESLMKENIKKNYPIIKTLTEVVKRFDLLFKEAKKEKVILDFNDLEHYCLKVLFDKNGEYSEAAKEYQEKFNEIITDEYQDSNIIQEMILSAVSKKSIGRNNRFMVGDIKQCIYKFRLANPEIFMKKYNSFSVKENSEELRIDLSQNFRSRKVVLDCINFIFCQLMSEKAGGVAYDDNSALHEGVVFEEPKENVDVSQSSELLLIDTTRNIDDQDFEELLDLTDTEIEASAVAEKIKSLMESNFCIYDKTIKGYRKLRYRDIVILLRNTKNKASVFSEVLSEKGIPAISDVGGGYFELIEVMTMLSLLQIIDNPRQDIPLITVLHSPIYDFSIDELTRIKIKNPNLSFYDALKNYDLDDNVCEKILKFEKDLIDFKKCSLYLTINELLQYIYDETNYFNYVGIFPNGSIRQANLKALQERAIQFEKTDLKGVFQFINYIERVKESSADFGDAKVLSQNEDVVQIMSIHKSKGLEFPVVFVSNLGRSFYMPDIKKSVILHQDLGFGPTYVDFNNRTSCNTIARYTIARQIKNESLAEELRILYVAFTRAKEKLILTGTVKKLAEKLAKWKRYADYEKTELPPEFVLNAASPLEWICTALARHTLLNETFDVLYIKNKALRDDNSNWRVSVITAEKTLNKVLKKEDKEELFLNLKKLDKKKDYSGKRSEIYEKLSWNYHNQIDNIIPSKVSISEIKRNAYIFHKDFEEPYDINLYEKNDINFEPPAFIQEEKALSSAQKGTAVHTVLEHINFKKDYTEEELKKLILGLKEKFILSEQEARAVDIKKLLSFCNSELYARIKASPSVKREVPFVIGLLPYEIYKFEEYKASNSTVLVHGIIDLYFEENGNYILVDYKTDRVYKNNIKEIVEKYKIQLDLYARAIEESTGRTVKEKYLYLFGNNTEIKC